MGVPVGSTATGMRRATGSSEPGDPERTGRGPARLNRQEERAAPGGRAPELSARRGSGGEAPAGRRVAPAPGRAPARPCRARAAAHVAWATSERGGLEPPRERADVHEPERADGGALEVVPPLARLDERDAAAGRRIASGSPGNPAPEPRSAIDAGGSRPELRRAPASPDGGAIAARRDGRSGSPGVPARSGEPREAGETPRREVSGRRARPSADPRQEPTGFGRFPWNARGGPVARSTWNRPRSVSRLAPARAARRPLRTRARPPAPRRTWR